MVVLNRLSQTVLVLLVAALVSFALIRYVGDPVNNMVGQAATLADRLAMRAAVGSGRSGDLSIRAVRQGRGVRRLSASPIASARG
jgi:ABC-type dipeptide/oligopeptide/nickel transport system permease component